MDALQAALEDALPAGINVPATGAQMVFTDRNVPERTVKVEVSNTSNWADAAFITGSGKRIKAVLLHQFEMEGVKVLGPLEPLADVRMTGACQCGRCFSSKLVYAVSADHTFEAFLALSLRTPADMEPRIRELMQYLHMVNKAALFPLGVEFKSWGAPQPLGSPMDSCAHPVILTMLVGSHDPSCSLEDVLSRHCAGTSGMDLSQPSSPSMSRADSDEEAPTTLPVQDLPQNPHLQDHPSCRTGRQKDWQDMSDEDFRQYLDKHQDPEYKIRCSQHPGLPLCPCKHKGYWKLEDIAPALKLFFQVVTCFQVQDGSLTVVRRGTEQYRPGLLPVLQVHASFHAQERSVTMAWQQFMELGHLRTCLADLTTILQACCIQTNQLMLTRNPVRVEGDNLLNDASARYMVNVPMRDLRAAKAAFTSDLAAAAKVAMFKPVDVYSAAVYLFGHICGAHYTLDIDEIERSVEAVHNGVVGWDEHHVMMRMLKAFLRAPKNTGSTGSRNKHALDFFLHTLHPLKAERMTAADALKHKLFSRPADQTDSLADLAASLLRM